MREWETYNLVERSNLYVIRVPGEERAKGAEAIFEKKLSKKFPKMIKILIHRIKKLYKIAWNRINTKGKKHSSVRQSSTMLKTS